MAGDASFWYRCQLLGGGGIDDAEVVIPLVGGYQERFRRCFRSSGGIDHNERHG